VFFQTKDPELAFDFLCTLEEEFLVREEEIMQSELNDYEEEEGEDLPYF
jgi:hypothetical protein